MTANPYIMTLDLATNTGFCAGRLGERPRFGRWRLKTPDDDQGRAGRNLGCRLRDEFTLQIPDLLIVEAAMTPAGMLAAGNASKTVSLLWKLSGAVDAVAGCYGVRVKLANVQSVRKAVLGQARFEEPKKAVLAFVNSVGLKTDDDNEGDAILMWLDEVGYRHGLPISSVLS